jgi:hypothetical protein
MCCSAGMLTTYEVSFQDESGYIDSKFPGVFNHMPHLNCVFSAGEAKTMVHKHNIECTEACTHYPGMPLQKLYTRLSPNFSSVDASIMHSLG